MNVTAVHPETYIEWRGGMKFDAGRAGSPPVRIDGDAKVGPGPFDTLLCALAACASTDVVSMLESQNAPLSMLRVTIEASRVTDSPRRLQAAVLKFAMRGSNLTRARAEQVVAESFVKYCGVRASLTAEAAISWSVDVLP